MTSIHRDCARIRRPTWYDSTYPLLGNFKNIQDFLPLNWDILNSVNGDLNNDGKDDIAFVLQYKDSVTIRNYKNGENPLTESEVKFWIETAKKEYFFIQDRAIKYETQEV